MIFRPLVIAVAFALAGSLAVAESAPAAPVTAAAGLAFASREISIVAKPGEPVVETAFTFVNRSDRAVVILEVKPACGCTVPTLEKISYEPGEEGKIRVSFHVGGRQGWQHLGVKVRTDAGDQDIMLKVEVPRRISIEPRLLVFRGEDAGPKTARVTYLAGAPVTLLEARNLPVGFQVEVRELEKGRDFEIVVSRVGEPVASTAIYELRTSDAAGVENVDRLYLRSAP